MEGVPPPWLSRSFLRDDKCSDSLWGSVHGQSPAFGSGLEIVTLGSQLVHRVENYPCVYNRSLTSLALKVP